MNNKQLALDTILQKKTTGIPTFWINIMEHSMIERIAGAGAGEYRKNPEKVYLDCQKAIGVCLLDQYIPENPLEMGAHGYNEGTERGATTGVKEIILDGIRIDSPEKVVEHMERFLFPELENGIRYMDENRHDDENNRIKEITGQENSIQEKLGAEILKTGCSFVVFPSLQYFKYGYENYFMAYALYPEVIEKQFSLQADCFLRYNRAYARVYKDGMLPPLLRLDHDMADSKSTLVDIKSLDRIWFPHFARCLEPLLKTDVRMIWHCDGNLMEMIPRLIEVGIKGFQGFQYEAGMDYERVCKMKTKDGNDLIIVGGVSVTETLPKKKPIDVRKELKWLVENGPKRGLFLGVSSSVTPGVPWENIETLIEGLKYYRINGRS